MTDRYNLSAEDAVGFSDLLNPPVDQPEKWTQGRRPDQINMIVVHCSATPAHMDIGKDEINKWHTAQGWIGIGYHYVIRRDGSIDLGRPLARPGAHVEGHNKYSIGVCLVGGVDKGGPTGKPEDNFTPMQKATLLVLLYQLRNLFPDTRICGHRDLQPKKACPSFDVGRWLLAQEFNPERRCTT